MAEVVVDFCEYRDVLDLVYGEIRERIIVAGVPVVNDEPDGVFFAVGAAFDAYREAYVRKEGVDEALQQLAVTVVLMLKESS